MNDLARKLGESVSTVIKGKENVIKYGRKAFYSASRKFRGN